QTVRGPYGPRATRLGWLRLPGVTARLRIRPSEAGGTDAARERTKLIPLVAPGRTVPAMPGPNAWHIPADSRLALRACDFARHPLTPERDAGLCREGSSDAEIPVQLAVRLAARLEVRPDARPWVEPRGFVLSARGELTLLNGLLLRLNYWPAHGDAHGDARGAGRGSGLARGAGRPRSGRDRLECQPRDVRRAPDAGEPGRERHAAGRRGETRGVPAPVDRRPAPPDAAPPGRRCRGSEVAADGSARVDAGVRTLRP